MCESCRYAFDDEARSMGMGDMDDIMLSMLSEMGSDIPDHICEGGKCSCSCRKG